MTTLLGIELSGRSVLIVGGGPVADRRARAALDDGARVTVVAPELDAGLGGLAASAKVDWRPRPVRPEDLDGVWLVQAATDSAEVNAAVADWASDQRVWCVNAGNVEQGSARTPATAHGDDLLVGVVSVGSPDPRRVRAVRDQLIVLLRSGRLDQRRHRRLDGRAAGRERLAS
ncbi:hypothetical protein GCM10009841_34010 [Microlunatus panaciterrae]|uniref:precorrin-2 dehydrogenase n=1 Tax=Microlunatus panaciterrae TaxID=400768 RepID=A0ABS2RGC7_9ACTN|nr:bifunctional precorrin-2 dehydrogenase/sirohydrochlorin ferrochelatase [Microlunatus panaciterrae]MBM7798060.1 siroheme synthase-like protein [Microlunatus panaciterrae]